MIPGTVILAGVVGSTAYGLAHEGSDVDRLGCYAAPTVQFHGLHPPTGKSASHVTTAPDATYHEAGKLAALLLACNPTVTELLWLDGYEAETAEGRDLIAIRSSFLSAKAVRNAYLGYATQQFKRVENRGDGSFAADLRNRTSKHARHLWRLLHQGGDLHRTGRLLVRLAPDEAAACRAFGERIEAGDLDLARKALADAEAVFDGPGVLPDRPDEAAAEKWLRGVREAYWERGPELSPEARAAMLEAPGSALCDCREGRSVPTSPRTGLPMDHHCDCAALEKAAAVLGPGALTAHEKECDGDEHPWLRRSA